MVPALTLELRNQARTRATERGYKHVWMNHNVVCVRKADKSKVISIITEADLDRID